MLSSCLISLPSNLQCFIFGAFFNPTRNIHRYKTRLSSRMIYAIPKARANYGTFNIGFQGAKIWNDISDDIKLLSLKRFKKNGFLAFRFLILAYLVFFCSLSFSTSFFSFCLCVFCVVVCGVWYLTL